MPQGWFSGRRDGSLGKFTSNQAKTFEFEVSLEAPLEIFTSNQAETFEFEVSPGAPLEIFTSNQAETFEFEVSLGAPQEIFTSNQAETCEFEVSPGAPQEILHRKEGCTMNSSDNTSQFDRLTRIIERLRAKDGCPWDREQTHESLKKACLEEAAEVVCGINIYSETGKADNLREELGDLLLQVVMHAQIAKEEGLFDMDDVCKDIADKMVRRHPHVFPAASEELESALSNSPDSTITSEQVLANWEDIKKVEHKNDDLDVNKYLFDAFDESKELIDAAIKRKREKLSKI